VIEALKSKAPNHHQPWLKYDDLAWSKEDEKSQLKNPPSAMEIRYPIQEHYRGENISFLRYV
jgi:hypothetical protein